MTLSVLQREYNAFQNTIVNILVDLEGWQFQEDLRATAGSE